MPLRIYVVRHGETAWSRSGQHTGTTDLPLLPEGIEEAKSLAPRLAGIAFSHVFCSPRQRAQQTAQLAGMPGPLVVEPGLQEWNYGDYEGLASPTIREKNPSWDIYRDGSPAVKALRRFLHAPTN